MSILDDVRAFNQKFRGDPEKRTRPIRQTGGDASVMEEVMNRPVAGGTTNLFQGANPGGAMNTGSAGNKFANPGGMPGNTRAQQILGSNYDRFLALGMSPSDIDKQLDNALAFGRGIDVGKIEDQLDRFEQFNASNFNETGIAPMIGDQQFLSVSKPRIVANEPEGVMGLLGAMFSPFGELAASGLEFLGSGGVGGRVLDAIKQKVGEGKDFLSNLNQPGTLGFRVRALTQAQRRFYDDLTMNQGVSPFQAIEQAERRATGGIATLQ
jgi:hypothetical protein